MSTQHTPGPWKAHVANSEMRTHCDHVNTVHGLHVCDVSSYGASLEQRAANARLIASAPDLLEELETAVARVALANSEGNPILSAWLPGARAALAKAKGGES